MTLLLELDAVEVTVVVDNEVDVLSRHTVEVVSTGGGASDIADRVRCDIGQAKKLFKMENICHGAHGLSMLITGVKDGKKRTILFDSGPEEDAFERNATRLGLDLSSVEVAHLSHWHRDHSEGGLLKAIEMIKAVRKEPLHVDLHPLRPYNRGIMVNGEPLAMQPDPTFAEIENAGGVVRKSDNPHPVLDGMFLVSGEIPRVTSYETGLKPGITLSEESMQWEEDQQIQDERFLMCNIRDKGIVVFTGCSHGGVINAVKEARRLCNAPLYAVAGGFHLVDGGPEKIQSTINDFLKERPRVLLANHCTGWKAKVAIENAMPGVLDPCTAGMNFRL